MKFCVLIGEHYWGTPDAVVMFDSRAEAESYLQYIYEGKDQNVKDRYASIIPGVFGRDEGSFFEPKRTTS